MFHNWITPWFSGIKSLMLHPLRSLLTVLGIFVGVASVIWLLAIGEGISQQAQQQIKELGATNIIVRSVKPTQDDDDDTFFFQYGILRTDYEAIKATIPNIKNIVRIREITRTVYYGTSETKKVRLVGCTPRYAEAMSLNLEEGSFISQSNLQEKDNVCVLSAELAWELFPLESPLNKSIPVKDNTYVVIGVMKQRVAMAGIGGSLSAQEFSDDIYVPITTVWSRIGDTIYTRTSGSRSGEVIELSQLTIQVNSVDEVVKTADAIREIMDFRHRQNDYAIVVPLELLKQAEITRMMFMMFMGLIAAISLLVGGIGIMNIMLATVTERTREIGIRRALGAKKSDITRQFLIETVVLSVVGGATGVLIGLTCPWVLQWLRESIFYLAPEMAANLPPVVQEITPIIVPISIPIAFSISVLIGVIFGLYPAMRAASMDPIEALRHE